MKLDFTITKNLVKYGANRHFEYRSPALRLLAPPFGVAFMVLGAYLMFTSQETHVGVAGGMAFGMGIVTFQLKSIRSKQAVKGLFTGKEDEIPSMLTTSDKGLKFEFGLRESRCDWSEYMDFKIYDDGILLYPQLDVFVWIPSSATFKEGDWDSFVALVATNIIRKA